MTVEEIWTRFPNEWILIENPKANKALEILGGKVVCHSKDRDEVYREAIARRLKRSATLYTGDIPEGTAVVL